MPLLRKLQEVNTSIVGLWSIDEPYQILYDAVKKNGFDISLLNNFKSELKQRQWLAARMLLNSMDPKIKKIHYNDFGAPLIDSGKFISLSHSQDLAVIILDDQVDVGIDIQFFAEKIGSIKKKFCSKNELLYTSPNNELEMLHIIWSAKETIYKRLKIPGLIFKEEIEVLPFELEESGLLKAVVNREGECINLDLTYEILNDYTFVYSLNT